MPLTTIADRKTPSTPLQITFGSQPIATGTKQAILIGHMLVSGTAPVNSSYQMQNVGDPDLARMEVEALAGVGSEISLMAQAFVTANSAVPGSANFPAFQVVFLASTETAFGTSTAALTTIKHLRADLIVSCYDASNATNRGLLLAFAALISGPDRDLNGQFGSFIVNASVVTSVTALAFDVDNQYMVLPYLQDTAESPSQSPAIIASGCAAILLASAFPHNPLANAQIGGLLPPVNASDRILSGPTELSELCLSAGLCPLKVDGSGNVRFIRTVTTRVTVDGTVPATAYFDWQDLVVLNDFREDCFLIINGPSIANQKASLSTAALIKDQILQLASLYEDEQAFQGVTSLASLFIIQPSTTSRGRFDFQIPINVVPGLAVVAGNIVATTLFDFTL
jgi:phage tail sheath gpL-like